MIEILVCINILVTIGLGFIIFLMNRRLKKGPDFDMRSPEQRMLEEFNTDPFMDDVMEYTLQHDIDCAIRPGAEDKTTLFYRDKETSAEYAITELFTCKAPRGSVTYTKAMKELTDRIDYFVKNYDIIKTQIKEKLS